VTADEWLQKLANLVRNGLPDAEVDVVDDGCLAICRGHVAIAITAEHGKVLAVPSLDRSGDGPWAKDRIAHEGALTFQICETSIRQAA
jgi:hypothetical protein